MQSATPKNKSFGLGSFPFARRYLGNRCFFLFLPLLRCFSSRRLPSITYGFSYGYLSSSQAGFPIRISPDRRLFAPPRSFSQLITSFIGSQCQGIHPALLFAWPFVKLSWMCSVKLKTRFSVEIWLSYFTTYLDIRLLFSFLYSVFKVQCLSFKNSLSQDCLIILA